MSDELTLRRAAEAVGLTVTAKTSDPGSFQLHNEWGTFVGLFTVRDGIATYGEVKQTTGRTRVCGFFPHGRTHEQELRRLVAAIKRHA